MLSTKLLVMAMRRTCSTFNQWDRNTGGFLVLQLGRQPGVWFTLDLTQLLFKNAGWPPMLGPSYSYSPCSTDLPLMQCWYVDNRENLLFMPWFRDFDCPKRVRTQRTTQFVSQTCLIPAPQADSWTWYLQHPRPSYEGGTCQDLQSAMLVDSITSCMDSRDLSTWGRTRCRAGRESSQPGAGRGNTTTWLRKQWIICDLCVETLKRNLTSRGYPFHNKKLSRKLPIHINNPITLCCLILTYHHKLYIIIIICWA